MLRGSPLPSTSFRFFGSQKYSHSSSVICFSQYISWIPSLPTATGVPVAPRTSLCSSFTVYYKCESVGLFVGNLLSCSVCRVSAVHQKA
jgi:hypothetical protein